MLMAYVASSLINVLTAIFDTLGFTHFGRWLDVSTVGGWTYLTRFNGLTMQPNHLGQECAIAAFLALGVYPRGGTTYKKGLWVTVVALLLIGVLGSGSRGALLAVASIGVILLAAYMRKIAFRFASLISLASVLATIVAIRSYLNSHVEIQGALDRLFTISTSVASSNETRYLRYSDALKDFASNPIAGVGFAHIGGVENVYLQFLQGAGMVGFIGFALYICPSVWKSIVLLRRDRDDLLMLSAACAVGVFLLTSLTQNLVYARFTLIPMGVLWAAVIHLHKSGLSRAPIYSATSPG